MNYLTMAKTAVYTGMLAVVMTACGPNEQKPITQFESKGGTLISVLDGPDNIADSFSAPINYGNLTLRYTKGANNIEVICAGSLPTGVSGRSSLSGGYEYTRQPNVPFQITVDGTTVLKRTKPTTAPYYPDIEGNNTLYDLNELSNATTEVCADAKVQADAVKKANAETVAAGKSDTKSAKTKALKP